MRMIFGRDNANLGQGRVNTHTKVWYLTRVAENKNVVRIPKQFLKLKSDLQFMIYGIHVFT